LAHAEDGEGQKLLGTRLCNSSGALPRLVSLLPLASLRTVRFLGYVVNVGSRKSKEGSRNIRDITLVATESSQSVSDQ
jgi:hypothetical protein